MLANPLTKMRIGTRLALGFAVLLSSTTLCVWIAGRAASNSQDALARSATEAEQRADILRVMYSASLNSAVAIRDVGLVGSIEEAERAERKYWSALKAYEAAVEKFSELNQDGQERELLTSIQKRRAAVEPAAKDALALARTFSPEQTAKILNERIAPTQSEWLADVERLLRLQAERRAEVFDSTQREARYSMQLAYALAAVAVALGCGIAWLLTRSVTGPILNAVELAEHVASGNLARTAETDGQDEAARLLRTMDGMATRLSTIVAGVRDTSESVVVATEQIAQGNSDLSVRTEQQAASVQQTASSMEQLTQSVKQSRDHAAQASNRAQAAASEAAAGGQAVEEVVGVMNDIRMSSKRVAEVTAVIDGIAFQTNILALNAAVEAARAGSHGRGFAVVAGEVRTLARNSAEAAKEIKTLIESAVANVEVGTHVAQTAGEKMHRIVGAVSDVARMVTQISEASAQQAEGIEHIGQSISSIDDMTQRNAALVEEIAAAASGLASQAADLAKSVSVFELRSA